MWSEAKRGRLVHPTGLPRFLRRALAAGFTAPLDERKNLADELAGPSQRSQARETGSRHGARLDGGARFPRR